MNQLQSKLLDNFACIREYQGTMFLSVIEVNTTAIPREETSSRNLLVLMRVVPEVFYRLVSLFVKLLSNDVMQR